LIESEDRSPRLVLEANRSHWNIQRGPRLERVIYRNDLSAAEAVELCISTEGEMDIVSEVAPADAERILASEHAKLIACDANRVLVGVFNRFPLNIPLDDIRVRKALNLAVDKQKIIAQGFAGYANSLCALTPSWCTGFPSGMTGYEHDAEGARKLLDEVGWPTGRKLRIAAPAPFEGIAQFMASDIEQALGIGVEVTAIPPERMLSGSRMLIEKKLVPPWDILLTGWFDLTSDSPPAAVHREFFGSDGAFRAGPEIPEFNRLFTEMATQIDGPKLMKVAEEIDRYVFNEALALFLCAPQALYAVNKHVTFEPYKTTLELAETEVDERHWSRKGTTAKSTSTQTTAPPMQKGTGSFASGSSGNAC
jgi:peptide/nickel transport system substrate-binding protein